MENKIRLSVAIIAGNEEAMIGDCLRSIRQFADEVIVIDTGSTDKTTQIAQKMGARVTRLKWKGHDFSGWRNMALKKSRGKWIFYLDADERATPLLKKEILGVIGGAEHSVYAIPRRNFYLGKEMRYGGAWPDYVQRLFLKESLKGWREKLHEYPEFRGKIGKLKNPMIHLTHRDLTSMMEKTIEWTKIEARLLHQARHPPVVWWRIGRMMLTKFLERVIKQQAWRDGTEGWINALFEVFNTFIIYARLWELQRK